MNTKDSNKHRMWTSVRGTLASQEADATWTTIPKMVLAVEEFDLVIAGVAKQIEITILPAGAAASKKAAKAALVLSAHEVAAATHAYATETGNVELAAEVDFSSTELAKGRPASVVARANRIGALADENIVALAEYNITQEKLTVLTAKAEAFAAVSSKPRQGVAKKAAANKALPRLLKQGQNILARRVDRLMVQFKESAPEFYAEYKSARKIVDQPGTQPERKASNVVTANTQPAELLKAA